MLGISALGQLALAQFPQVHKVVGWIQERRYHDPAELEERIQRQKDKTFGRRWYEEFREAQIELETRAKEAPKAQRKAFKKAVKAVERIPEAPIDFEPIARVLQSANSAKSTSEALELSRRIDAIVKEMLIEAKRLADEDEEDSIMLLLNG